MKINEHTQWVWVGRHHIISNGEILFLVIAIIVGIFGFWVTAGLAAWIMQERSILPTDSVMNSLNMGTASKSLVLFPCLFSLLTWSSCASLPRIEDYDPLRADTTPKIIGPKGQLSPKISKAIIDRLKGQVEPTDILQHHILLVKSISGSSLVTGNKVTLLIDGPATYATMFKAIRNATDHINLETFIMGDIFENDETGLRLTDLLLQKQAEGVQVNLLYDSVGSYNTPASFFQRLRDGGIDAAEFNQINPLKASRERRNLLETLSPHLANSEVFMMDFSTV